VPKVLLILADGFEEMEAVAPIDILRRAKAEVTVAALGAGIHVTGRNGIVVHADTTLDAVLSGDPRDYDCLLLPGGPGVALVLRQNAAGRLLAAICAAPLVLADAGVLDGRRFTAHFSTAAELPRYLPGERTVEDGNILTSRGAGTAADFGLLLVERLFGRDLAREIAASICA
jgi:4-methyl-5(b-hydroxyethyl)-thiazole monophosphate biosynthesis